MKAINDEFVLTSSELSSIIKHSVKSALTEYELEQRRRKEKVPVGYVSRSQLLRYISRSKYDKLCVQGIISPVKTGDNTSKVLIPQEQVERLGIKII